MVFGGEKGRRSTGDNDYGCFTMSIAYGIELWLAFPLAPAAVYMASYFWLRLLGKLRVAPGGWHAGCFHVGSRVVVQALLLFAVFQPLLRIEAAARRACRSRRAELGETAVSEVVVELIPMA